MSELRFDYTTADWVIFAPLRKLRPHESGPLQPAAAGEKAESTLKCPFCPGNEELAPHEIDAARSGGGSPSNWRVRVVPNKFPALRIEEDHRRIATGEMFQHMSGCGAHEVLVESPDHDAFLGNQPVEQIQLVLQTLHKRYVDLLRDRRFQAIVAFKNHGLQAGTSLKHPHWQVIATPVVPRLLRLKCREAAEYFDRTGRGLYEVLLDQELAAGTRIVAANSEFVAFVPYAAHLAFETWIMPRRAQSSFSNLAAEQLPGLALLLKTVLLKLYVGLEDPDFNLTIDTAPRDDEDETSFRWHIRVLPRVATAAGFEMGSGMSINTVMPEEAAEFLRAENHVAG